MADSTSKPDRDKSWLSNQSLSHKILLLLGLPFAFQLIFFWITFNAMDRADMELAQTEYAKQVTSRISELGHGLVSLMSSGYDLTAHKDSNSSKLYKANKQQIQNQLSDLRTLLANRKSDLAILDRMQNIYDRAFMLLDETIRSASWGDKTAALDTLQSMKSLRREFGLQTDNLSEVYNRIQQEGPRHETLHRAEIKKYLWWSLLGNWILIAAIGLVIRKNVLNPIKVLMTNIDRLARGQQLAPRVGGRDEVGRLDSTFHDMSHSLKLLEEKKQQFVAMLTHDLRSPLSSVRLVIQLLGRGVYGDNLSDRGKGALDKAEHSIYSMLSIINNLLDAEKAAAGKLDLELSEVPLAHIFEKSLDTLRPQAEFKSVTLMADETDIELTIDEEKITRVLVNLVGNALKFTPENSTVCIVVTDHGDDVEIGVKDQGPGIPDEFKNKLFDRFQQVDLPSHKIGAGTGLGLVICKDIVTLHGGIIGVTSAGGHGTTFWFRLPKRVSAPIPLSEADRAAELLLD
jgi:signal transduction histidine kinase